MAKVASGASTSTRHAVKRAITEFMQAFALQDETTEQDDECSLRLLQSAPKLKKLISCSSVESFKKSKMNFTADMEAASVNQIVNMHIIPFIKTNKGVVRFGNVGYEGATICQCYIPGLDRFHLIRSGNAVAPIRVFKHE